MKIDIFPHILPAKYYEALDKKMVSYSKYFSDSRKYLPTLVDLDYRFRIMDKFVDLMQVLTLSMPPGENIGYNY